MKYAKSLLYGIIVDAVTSDYQDYANWQLRCPKCGEPVHLIGASERVEHVRLAPKSKQIVLVSSAKISASFAHFKGLADEACENFNSQISKNYIEKFERINREQRLKVYNQRFLEIVGYNKSMKGCFFDNFKKVNKINNKVAKSIEQDAAKDFYSTVSQLTKLAGGARILLEGIKSDKYPLNRFDTSRAKDEEVKQFVRWVQEVDIDRQMILLEEAIAFLKTRAARAIALQLLELCFSRLIFHRPGTIDLIKISGNSIAEEDSKYRELIERCVTELVQIFALTDWAGAVGN
ncbi:hypothetical protein A6769_38675 [Nostoc punctiforme NIES-2108]|uniref:Uncharacterized protein n=2 Tax=Nostoc punctiforme TaxID=272131 RepID=B2ITD7_NOSP7|nr:hypothetical protein Npun_F2614 [Nostoc punctiforme PCC 73102]RCJ41163.1 hypothetical protein A6769_38675 [Nostoc punctiforme NIES-2108]